MPLRISARRVEEFFGSDPVWRVDVVDWAATQPAFRKIIERDKVVLQRQGGGNSDEAPHVPAA